MADYVKMDSMARAEAISELHAFYNKLPSPYGWSDGRGLIYYEYDGGSWTNCGFDTFLYGVFRYWKRDP